MSASSVPLLFFAKSRELAGTAEAHLDRPSPSTQTHIRCADLLLDICQRHNLHSIKDNVILAVNGEYCSNADELIEWSGVTEVAVIPPISGERLDLNGVSELITHESCGAVSFFVGTTRDNFDDKQVTSLEYEAYDRMALKSLTQICDELRAQWPDIKHIAIHHRLGVVPVREASVIIGISSPHRQTSLLAVQLAIDRLKQIVPIWKKERYQNVDGTAPSAVSAHSAKPTHRRKRRAVDFNSCVVPVELPTDVPQRLVQIHANAAELRRRLNCFVDQKRDEINQNNVQDFIEPADPARLAATGDNCNGGADGEEMSCARIRSSVYRSKDASSHLRIHRVMNEYGPQERQNYTDALDKLMTTTSVDGAIDRKHIKSEMGNAAICERLQDTESAVGLKPTPGSVYVRLKAIEQRIQFLETASPEYSHFVSSGVASSVHVSRKPTKPQHPKQTYTPADVEMFIQKLQQNTTGPAATT